MNEDKESVVPICRFCKENINQNEIVFTDKVVRPCKCRSYLHQKCFREWNLLSASKKCETCQTKYILQQTVHINKEQIIQNYRNLGASIVYILLYLLSIFLTYGIDLGYLKYLHQPVNQNELLSLFLFHQAAISIAIYGTMYLIDAMIFLKFETLRHDIKFNHVWISFLGMQLYLLVPRPNEDTEESYNCMTFLFVIFLILCSGLISFFFNYVGYNIFLENNNNIITLIILAVVLIIIGTTIHLLYHVYIQKESIIIKIKQISMVLIAQLIFQLIGRGFIKILPITVTGWKHIIDNTNYFNVFTYAVGALMIFVGLLTLQLVLSLLFRCFCCVNNFFCPKMIIPQLGEYSEDIENQSKKCSESESVSENESESQSDSESYSENQLDQTDVDDEDENDVNQIEPKKLDGEEN